MPLLNNDTAAALEQRLLLLTPDSKPRWGVMSVTQMLAHCSTALRMAFGEVPLASKFGPVKAAAARFLFIEVLPFPKGKTPTAPELDAQKKLVASNDFEAERDMLIAQLRRMNATTAGHRFAPHPIFSFMSRRQWGKLVCKHLHHHLKQFGV